MVAVGRCRRKWQILLDRSHQFTTYRWAGFAAVMFIYALRVYLLDGWYIVTYGLGIYLLNMLIGFLSPPVDPETDGPMLPTTHNEEFRPFMRRVPEFHFWYGCTKATAIALVMTFFDVFNIPVFWPILLYAPLAAPRAARHMLTPWGRPAPPQVLLHCAVRFDDEATDQAHDQVQVSAVDAGQAHVQGQEVAAAPARLNAPLMHHYPVDSMASLSTLAAGTSGMATAQARR